MREFNEYEDKVIENLELDLVPGERKYIFIDKKRGVWVEGNHDTCLTIGYVGKDEDIVAKNTRKMIGITYQERLEDEYLNFDLEIIDDKKYESACISFKRGHLPVLIYNKSKSWINSGVNPVASITVYDDKLVVIGDCFKSERTITASEFTVEGMVNDLCNFVRNMYNSNEWKAEIESLLNAIKPALTLCVKDAKAYWLNYIYINAERCQRGIDSYDRKIEKLEAERLRYVEDYKLFKEAADALEQDEQEKIENNRKK